MTNHRTQIGLGLLMALLVSSAVTGLTATHAYATSAIDTSQPSSNEHELKLERDSSIRTGYTYGTYSWVIRGEYEVLTGWEGPNDIVTLEQYNVIADRALSGKEDIKQFKLSESLEAIGVGAFRNCTSLESMDIPSTVNGTNYTYSESSDWLLS